MDPSRVYRLRNAVQHYAWGSRTAIPELLGEPSPGSEPWAELWMGAHPKAPSQVLGPEGPLGLDAFVAQDPVAVLGERVAARFGGALPFLFKVLAAEAPLSIQAHPDREQAQEGFARENRAGIPLGAPERCYADANPKPELICALSRFHALDRFRELGDVVARLEALETPEVGPVLAGLGRLRSREGLKALFRGLWQLEGEPRRAVLARALECAREDGGRDPALRWVAELAGHYPDDIGVLAPLLLNVVTLEPGEAMFLPAGELHSYLSGVGIEIMASSDNVLRGGLTPKHVDVEELLRTLSFRSGAVEILKPQPAASGEVGYDTPAEEFALARLEVAPGRPFVAPVERALEILLCTRGAGRFVGAEPLDFERGACLLVPAGAPRYRIEGEATLHRATVAGAEG